MTKINTHLKNEISQKAISHVSYESNLTDNSKNNYSTAKSIPQKYNLNKTDFSKKRSESIKNNNAKNKFMESGKNIIYGGGDENKKTESAKINEKNDLDYNTINYNDNEFDYEEDKNLDKNLDKNIKQNTSRSNSINLDVKFAKLNKVMNPYERLKILEQLEIENQKKSEEILEKLAKNQNVDDIY